MSGNNLTKQTALIEKGDVVSGRGDRLFYCFAAN